MWLLTALQICFLTLIALYRNTQCFVMTKTQRVVNNAKEQTFSDTFAIISILLAFKSFLMLLRHSTRVS